MLTASASSSLKQIALETKLPQNVIAQTAEMACRFSQKAYAPYSGLHVGAALLMCKRLKSDASFQIFGGCNVENSSFSLCMCAERIAMAKAVGECAAGVVEEQDDAFESYTPTLMAIYA